MDRRSTRIWMLLGLLCLLVASVLSEYTPDTDSTPDSDPELSVTLEDYEQEQPLANDRIIESQTTPDGQATELVSKALAILQTLDPAPASSKRSQAARQESKRSGGLFTKIVYYTKLVSKTLLVHKPKTLEEPVDGGAGGKKNAAVGGLHGRKLKSAVEKLEAARERAKNPDAIYLLAQMNFYGNWSYPRNYPAAFGFYKELAELTGNSTAQNMVGFMYATGIGGSVERDQAKALLYHTFAALNGDTRSEMTVAFRHFTGIGTSRHCDEAAFYYKRVADKAMNYWLSGPPGGHTLVKHSYRLADDQGGVYGDGASAYSAGVNAARRGASADSAKDLDDILDYLDLMARKGEVSAIFSLGKLYYDGTRHMPRNVHRAKIYFENVCKQYWTREGKVVASGPPGLEKVAGKSAGFLGKIYLRGEGVQQNFPQAIRWFKRGVSNGDPASLNGLGFMYLNGYGVKADRQKAADFFQAATDQDFPQAQINLGKLFLDQNDVEIAKRYFELAARHGTLEAYYYLAEIYNTGLTTERSCSLAVSSYKIAVEKVEPIQSPLVWANKAYADGDKESALIGYMMAAEQGYEAGQANVAFLLDEEKSRFPLRELLEPKPKDTRSQELALIYWTRSAKQANTDSLVKMGDYYLSGIGTESDYEKAASCYQAASELQASAQALWNLGWMHENGIGVEQDFHLAKRFYDLALETNQEAYLPVTLSLLKLRVRSFWNTITGGSINAIGADPHPPKPKKHPTFREFLKKWYEATPENYAAGPNGAAGADVDEYGTATATTHHDTDADDHDQPHVGGDDFYNDDFDDDMVESVIILFLAAAVAILVYYRQQRQQNLARQQQPAGAEAGQQPGGGGQQPQFPAPGGGGAWGWGFPH